MTPMMGAAEIIQASRDGDVSAVRRLLSGDFHLVHATDNHLKTPLHWAAEYDRSGVAEILLEAGADLEATTSWGATPFD
jgi:ankyrin repeat protein